MDIVELLVTQFTRWYINVDQLLVFLGGRVDVLQVAIPRCLANVWRGCPSKFSIIV
jgi:hypothetical protein